MRHNPERHSPRTARPNGYTFVEMLVVLVLFGFMTVAMYGTVAFGLRSLERVRHNAVQQGDIVSAQRFIRRRLAGSVSATAGWLEPPFFGARNRVRFSSPWLVDVGQGTVFRFDLYIENRTLKVAWRPAFGDDVSAENVQEMERDGQRSLVHGVAGIRIRYFGTDGGRELGWVDRWPASSRLPLLVEIALELEPPRQRHWPMLTVRLAS